MIKFVMISLAVLTTAGAASATTKPPTPTPAANANAANNTNVNAGGGTGLGLGVGIGKGGQGGTGIGKGGTGIGKGGNAESNVNTITKTNVNAAGGQGGKAGASAFGGGANTVVTPTQDQNLQQTLTNSVGKLLDTVNSAATANPVQTFTPSNTLSNVAGDVANTFNPTNDIANLVGDVASSAKALQTFNPTNTNNAQFSNNPVNTFKPTTIVLPDPAEVNLPAAIAPAYEITVDGNSLKIPYVGQQSYGFTFAYFGFTKNKVADRLPEGARDSIQRFESVLLINRVLQLAPQLPQEQSDDLINTAFVTLKRELLRQDVNRGVIVDPKTMRAY